MNSKRIAPSQSPQGESDPAGIDQVRLRVGALLPRDETGVLPLCYTIEAQICNRLRDVDPELIRIVLREVTVETDYLNRVITDEWRHALNGERIERIDRYQREFASGVLALREAWEREKR